MCEKVYYCICTVTVLYGTVAVVLSAVLYYCFVYYCIVAALQCDVSLEFCVMKLLN